MASEDSGDIGDYDYDVKSMLKVTRKQTAPKFVQCVGQPGWKPYCLSDQVENSAELIGNNHEKQ